MLKLPLALSLLTMMLISISSTAQNFYKEKISRDNILSIGLGPSFVYFDNAGQYRSLNFEIRPSASIAYTKKLSSIFDIRATAGIQSISSGGDPSFFVTNSWSSTSSSFTAKGSALYFDLMPTINLISYDNHIHRSKVNLYGGAGIGIMYSQTKQTKSFSEDEIPSENSITTGYVPVRVGLSLRVGPYSDIAGEGTMLLTFTDNMDGNIGFNKFADHLMQAQIVYRRYFVPKAFK